MVRAASAYLAALFLAIAGPAWASTLSVSPIRLVLTPGAPLGTFTVNNEGGLPARAQLVMSTWRQEDGKDVLTPTRDVLVNPTIFEVGANSRQLVRLGLQVPAAAVERSYRLVLDEIPTAAQIKAGTIGVRLRISVPLFVPVEGAVADLGWRATVNGRDIRFDISNKGGRHAQILRLKISRAGGATLLDTGASVYILPGSTGQPAAFKLSAPVAPGEMLRIDAKTDNGDVHASVRADRS